MTTKKNLNTTTNSTAGTATYKPAVTWKEKSSEKTADSAIDNKQHRAWRNSDHDAEQCPQEIIEQVDAVYDRMREAFSAFLAKEGWTNARASREFFPYISNPSAVTKILNGKQEIRFEVFLVMALRYNEPLDTVLLGQAPTAPVLTSSETETILRLAERICPHSK